MLSIILAEKNVCKQRNIGMSQIKQNFCFEGQELDDPLGGSRGLGCCSKYIIFRNMVIWHIKLKGIRHTIT